MDQFWFPAARRVRAAVVGLLAVAIVSCGAKGTIPVYSVSGKAYFKGQPAAGARVILFAEDESAAKGPHPQATVGADGSFQLSTFYQADGAPAGRYTATVHWPSDSKREEDGTPIGPDRLGKRYVDPKTSPLKVEVQAKPTELEPFELK